MFVSYAVFIVAVVAWYCCGRVYGGCAGKHVVQFFVQYAPYDVDPKYGNWADDGFKNAFADRVFGVVDQFCPGFSSSVLARDLLSPLDLERIFGLVRCPCH